MTKVFASLLALLTAFLAIFGFSAKQRKTPEGAIMTIAAISDTHVNTDLDRRIIFKAGVRDISERVSPDVLVITGDCTDHGQTPMWDEILTTMRQNCTVPNVILTEGNHDTWSDGPDDDGTYENARNKYLKYTNLIMSADRDSVYFTTVINGIYFITLGSEDDTTDAVLSDVQIDWVDAQLAQAAANAPGKPVFVLLHQPMNNTHTVGENIDHDGIRGDKSEKLQAVLEKYENVIYMCGHIHHGLNDGKWNVPEGYTTIEKVSDHVTSINLPCYMFGNPYNGGNILKGTGLVLDVFEDRVEIIGRDFLRGGWLENFTCTIPLSGAQTAADAA